MAIRSAGTAGQESATPSRNGRRGGFNGSRQIFNGGFTAGRNGESRWARLTRARVRSSSCLHNGRAQKDNPGGGRRAVLPARSAKCGSQSVARDRAISLCDIALLPLCRPLSTPRATPVFDGRDIAFRYFRAYHALRQMSIDLVSR